MARVFLGVGHGGSDPGASAYGLIEKNMNLVMALACRDELVRHGVIVGMSRTVDENDELYEEIRECKAFNPDIAIDVHNNAGGGDGFEFIYSIDQKYTSGKDLRLGKLIESEVIKIGQNSRGGKTKSDSSTGRDYFGFIRELDCPSIIVEGCFLDSSDRFIADTVAEQKAFGVAYAKGILAYFGIAYKPVVSQPAATNGKPWRVVCGSFETRANANAQQTKLKAKGFDSFLLAYTTNKTTSFRVVCGSFESKTNATQRQAELKKAGFDSFIVQA